MMARIAAARQRILPDFSAGIAISIIRLGPYRTVSPWVYGTSQPPIDSNWIPQWIPWRFYLEPGSIYPVWTFVGISSELPTGVYRMRYLGSGAWSRDGVNWCASMNIHYGGIDSAIVATLTTPDRSSSALVESSDINTISTTWVRSTLGSVTVTIPDTDYSDNLQSSGGPLFVFERKS